MPKMLVPLAQVVKGCNPATGSTPDGFIVGSRIREIPVSDPVTVRSGAGKPTVKPEDLSGD